MISEKTANAILKYTDGVKLNITPKEDYDETTSTVSLELVNDFYHDVKTYVESVMYRPLSDLTEHDRKAVKVAMYKLTAIKFIDKVAHETSGSRLDWSRELESEAMRVINSFKAEGLFVI